MIDEINGKFRGKRSDRISMPGILLDTLNLLQPQLGESVHRTDQTRDCETQLRTNQETFSNYVVVARRLRPSTIFQLFFEKDVIGGFKPLLLFVPLELEV